MLLNGVYSIPGCMVFIFFSGLNFQGELHEYSIGSSTIESSFELLNNLVSAGCVLISVKLDIGTGSYTTLPVDAFDGQSMKEPLKQLQQQWEEILATVE